MYLFKEADLFFQMALRQSTSVVLLEDRERHIVADHASLEAMAILRASRVGFNRCPKAVFKEKILLNFYLMTTLSLPNLWAFNEKKSVCGDKVRMSAMKRFDHDVGFLGADGAPTRWVRVVVDVNIVSRCFEVVTCYPVYHNEVELKKKETCLFREYEPPCVCFQCAITPDVFFETVMLTMIGVETKKKSKPKDFFYG